MAFQASKVPHAGGYEYAVNDASRENGLFTLCVLSQCASLDVLQHIVFYLYSYLPTKRDELLSMASLPVPTLKQLELNRSWEHQDGWGSNENPKHINEEAKDLHPSASLSEEDATRLTIIVTLLFHTPLPVSDHTLVEYCIPYEHRFMQQLPSSPRIHAEKRTNSST